MRRATEQDYDQVWRILREAAGWMMQKGRDQWDDKYPTAQSVHGDIQHGDGWVIDDGEQVVAYCAISFSGEPSYDALEGEWLTAGPYAVVHRMAVALTHRGLGMADRFFDHAEQMCRERRLASVRVDTNHDNREMLALIARRGYQPTGRCYYYHGGRHVERLAFELPL